MRKTLAQRVVMATLLVAVPPLSVAQPPVDSIRISLRGRVQRLALDDYVARVIAGEGEPKAADAAQDALAIAIRTFALANRNRHRRENYDLCDTTHCQVLRSPTPASRRAAESTAGRVLVHRGQPATIYYSAWCGGRPERASEVWPGATEYSSVTHQSDEACKDEPQWRSEIPIRDIERALRVAGLEGSRLRRLQVLQRNESGRVTRLAADGFSPREISGSDFRMAMIRIGGPHALKSTIFESRATARGYQFEGRGYGHGVGLCVVGAGRRAIAGATTEDILQFYYPGLTVERVHALGSTTTAARTTGTTLIPKPVRDIEITLSTRDESERATLAELIRKSRAEIASRAGVPANLALRVTVHDSVDSFTRATGQPWWMTGVAQGVLIDLAPLSVLRQQGQLERAIRHEVAHAIVVEPLGERHLWVREGAALHLAGLIPPNAANSPRVTCPKDDEFLRPVSAGAYRDAVARAAICFARAIRDGKSWKDVR